MYPSLFFNKEGARRTFYMGLVWKSGNPMFIAVGTVALDKGINTVHNDTWLGLLEALYGYGWQRVPYTAPVRPKVNVSDLIAS